MAKEGASYAYEVLKTLALACNYNKWIIDLIKSYIKGSILEVGCGIGNLTAYLCKFGKLTCIDISPIFIKHMQIDYPEIEFHLCDISDRKILNLGKKYDTVVCVNVLEHVENDMMALDNIYKLLNPRGCLLLYVPALKRLYGSMDKYLRHWRRYEREDIKKKLETIGFKIVKISYSNLPGIIGWFLNGKVFKRKKFSILQPLIFDKVVPLIAKIEKIFEPPIGMSLLIIAKKS